MEKKHRIRSSSVCLLRHRPINYLQEEEKESLDRAVPVVEQEHNHLPLDPTPSAAAATLARGPLGVAGLSQGGSTERTVDLEAISDQFAARIAAVVLGLVAEARWDPSADRLVAVVLGLAVEVAGDLLVGRVVAAVLELAAVARWGRSADIFAVAVLERAVEARRGRAADRFAAVGAAAVGVAAVVHMHDTAAAAAAAAAVGWLLPHHPRQLAPGTPRC